MSSRAAPQPIVEEFTSVAGVHLERLHIATTKRFKERRDALASEEEVLKGLRFEVNRLETEKGRLEARMYAAAARESDNDDDGPKPFKPSGAMRSVKPETKVSDAVAAVDMALAKAKKAVEAQDAYVSETKSGKAETVYTLQSAEVVNNYYVHKARYEHEARTLRNNDVEAKAARAEFEAVSRGLYRLYIERCHPELRSPESHMAAMRLHKVCRFCGSELEIHVDIMRCTGCGHCERDVGGGIVGETYQSYDDQERVTTVRIYRYERLNHFREILRLRQGITRTGVTPRVSDKFAAALKRYKVDPLRLTPEFVRIMLKRIDEASSYKFAHCICADFNPTYSPIVIEPEHFERLVRQFVAAETPYEMTKHKVNAKRKNFLHYPSVAIALCKMNGYTEYLRAFKPLKSVELRIQQDRLWKEVCEANYWPYVNAEGASSIACDFSGRVAKRRRVYDAEKEEDNEEEKGEDHAEAGGDDPAPWSAMTSRRGAPVAFK